MNDLVIKIPVKKYISHPKIEALKGTQIGPCWSLPDPTRVMGMRGVESRDTKNHKWVEYRIKRSKRNKIAKRSRIINAKMTT